MSKRFGALLKNIEPILGAACDDNYWMDHHEIWCTCSGSPEHESLP